MLRISFKVDRDGSLILEISETKNKKCDQMNGWELILTISVFFIEMCS